MNKFDSFTFRGTPKMETWTPQRLVNYYIKLRHEFGLGALKRGDYGASIKAAKLLIAKHGNEGAALLVVKSFMLSEPPDNLFILLSDKFIDMLGNLIGEEEWRTWKRVYPNLTKGF